jgi:hypothetical protein
MKTCFKVVELKSSLEILTARNLGLYHSKAFSSRFTKMIIKKNIEISKKVSAEFSLLQP